MSRKIKKQLEGNLKMLKETIRRKLENASTSDFCSLWKGSEMDKYYKCYEVSELSHQEPYMGNGPMVTYDGVYSLNDGKISDKMKSVLIEAKEKGVLTYPVWIYTNRYGNEQAFFGYHNGSNGKENCSMNSMIDAGINLGKLTIIPNVYWATCLDAYFDTCDDVYTWLFTLEVNEESRND